MVIATIATCDGLLCSPLLLIATSSVALAGVIYVASITKDSVTLAILVLSLVLVLSGWCYLYLRGDCISRGSCV